MHVQGQTRGAAVVQDLQATQAVLCEHVEQFKKA
jgi:hypothetical protein